MDEEEQDRKQDLYDSFKEEYKEILKVTDLDNALVCAFLKLNKIAVELQELSNAYHDFNIDCDAMESLLRMDVLLGAVGEVRSEIKKSL